MRCLTLVLLLAASTACTREAGLFVENNARAHVEMLAGSIGSRPVGTAANLKARQYIVDQLKQIGFVVRVQETDARRHELGRTARVANIIAMLQGERPEALALVSHYDSSPDAPGATDAALGVGVVLEAARVVATTGQPRWSLFVLLTDGEESGLMGAAGLVTDRDVMDRLRAYINLESIGSAGTAVLFETGPGNAWLVSPWARYAPHPRGGSYALEIYLRLPNDTDFSVLKTRDVPGLNFAAVGDSYAYHTARDTPERLARDTIRNTGENVVTLVNALQPVDITARTPQGGTFFDVGGTVGVTYGPVWHWLISAAAILLGVFAWVRLTADAIRHNGMLRWLLTFVWGWLGAALVGGTFVAATWLLRTAREVYHPWYAHPTRLFVLMLLMGVTLGWSLARAGQWLPGRVHPSRHPALVWSVALPGWLALALLALWFGPAAAYLWMLPLLAAGLLFAVIPAHADTAVRAASFVVFAVAGTLWGRDTYELLQFVVAVMGRLPVVTPVFVFASLLGAATAMMAPPLIAMLVVTRPLGRPWLVTALLLLVTVAAAGSAYMAPAYTPGQPLRRAVRALQEPGAPTAIWEIGSVEPGLDLSLDAPQGWMPATDGAATTVPWGRYRYPFVFRTAGPPLGPAPAAVSGFEVSPLPDGTRMTVSVVPREGGLWVSFLLPAGVTPARSSLPGVQRLGRWTATFVAPPAEGIAWEASFRGVSADRLRDTRVLVAASGFPGGAGWQRLPDWLPQETAVWSAAASWVLPVQSASGIAPVPPLR